ncbi:oligosaccharide flippase family protein [Luteibacter flocculans]|uniref:Oligosaccharide flippase family protein n=1 Tax=Luteibacter flocculans TaxID=2780091 RepID=A0ABY4T3Z1_9GAMM|nr:oligosaccharide flippase family protein [Luteibacter flocculans]URL59420.1 oligosaccharide flippase family protein [Luteibacter flocculans]
MTMGTRRWHWSQWLGPRGQSVLRTGSWSLIAKCVAAINLFVALPFVMRSLGPAEFGVWATLVSVMTFAGFLDFGIGNGAMNMIADALGRGRLDEVRIVLREASSVLVRIALIMLVAAVAMAWLPWWRMLGLSQAADTQATSAALIALAIVACGVPLSLATRTQLGLGLGHIAFRWQAFGQVFSLIATITAALLHAGLAWLVAAALSSTAVPAVLNAVSLWRHPVHGMAQRPAPSRRPDVRQRIRRDGFLFFVLQLGGAVAFTIDLPLITAIRGPVEAGEYAVVQRLFSVIPLTLSLLWVPLWPIYRTALAAYDFGWVRRTLARSVIGAGGFAVAAALFFSLAFAAITHIWLHKPLSVSWVLLGGFVAWSSIEAVGQALATFLNAAGILRFQVAVAVLLAILSIGLKLAALILWDASLVPWCTFVAYTLTSLIPTIIRLPAFLHRANSSPADAR